MPRMVGIDLGSRRIGVAVSDETGLIAQPRSTIARHGGVRDLQAIAAVVAEVNAAGVVVGLPLNPDAPVEENGGRAAHAARTFADRLRAVLPVPVELIDESFTTVEAEAVLVAADLSRARRRQVVDRVAAALILQRWLDTQPRGKGPS